MLLDTITDESERWKVVGGLDTIMVVGGGWWYNVNHQYVRRGGQALPPGFYRILGNPVFWPIGLFFCLPVTDRLCSR
jgi:hypothetical protein